MAKLDLERINGLWILAVGPTLIAAALLVYILVLESTFGAFTVSEVAPSAANGPQVPRVALLNSEYTRHIHTVLQPDGRDAGRRDAIIRSWHDFLFDADHPFFVAEVTDVQVELGVLSTYDMLILPSVSAMSDRQIEEVRSFIEQGGSVLATVTPGVYAPRGSYRGWQFAEDVFGVEFVDLLDPFSAADGGAETEVTADAPATGPGAEAQLLADAQTVGAEVHVPVGAQAAIPVLHHVALRGDTPLTVNLPGGSRLALRRDFAGVGVRPAGSRAYAAAYWRDASFEDDALLEDLDAEDSTAAAVAVAYGTRGNGRFVYLGFDRAAVAEREARPHVGESGSDDSVEIRRDRATAEEPEAPGVAFADHFFENILAYLLRRPTVRIHQWPYPHIGGAAVSVVAEDQIEYLPLIADLFEQEVFPATYLARPHEARRFPTLFERMHAAGSVAVLADLGPQEDGTAVAQSERLAELKKEMELVVRGAVVGYGSTREGRLHEPTLTALADAGFGYVIVDTSAGPVTPQPLSWPHERLLEIALTSPDDYHLVQRVSIDEGLLPVIEANLVRALLEGGLFHHAVHTDLLGRPEHHDLLRQILRRVKRTDLWPVSTDDLTRWWRLRSGLSAFIETRSRNRIVLRVTNNNGTTVDRIGVTVALGRSVARVRVRPDHVHTTRPQTSLQADRTELVLSIARLKPQQTRIFHIDLLDDKPARP